MLNNNRFRAGAPLAAIAFLSLSAVLADTTYQRPPQVLADIVEAPATPAVRMSPDNA